jgi:hypothetical protein
MANLDLESTSSRVARSGPIGTHWGSHVIEYKRIG